MSGSVRNDGGAGRFIRFFEEVGIDDVPLVGGKNASLGEMYRELTPRGILVPNGFAVTAEGYRHALDAASAWPRLREALDGLHPNDVDDLARRAARARDIVYGVGLPADLDAQIRTAFAQLTAQYGGELTVAVRSSATAEDLPNASFAGQHESYLNVRGEAGVCRRVPPLLRLPLHRPRHSLSHRQRLRSFQGRTLGRRDEDGALRSSPRAASSSPSTPKPGFATSSSSPAPTAWARTSCRARSIRTNSMSSSRPIGTATARCCGARSAARRSG